MPALSLLRTTLGIATLVVVSTSCGSATTGRSGDSPPPLHLVGGAAADAQLAAGSTSAWRLAATLPSGTPDPAPVFDLAAGQVAQTRVAALAQVLGLDAEPRRSGAGWVVQRR